MLCASGDGNLTKELNGFVNKYCDVCNKKRIKQNRLWDVKHSIEDLSKHKLEVSDLEQILAIRRELWNLTQKTINRVKADKVTKRELLKSHYLCDYWKVSQL